MLWRGKLNFAVHCRLVEIPRIDRTGVAAFMDLSFFLRFSTLSFAIVIRLIEGIEPWVLSVDRRRMILHSRCEIPHVVPWQSVALISLNRVFLGSVSLSSVGIASPPERRSCSVNSDHRICEVTRSLNERTVTLSYKGGMRQHVDNVVHVHSHGYDIYLCLAFIMKINISILPLVGSLGLLAEAVPSSQPAVTFVTPSKLSPGSAQNVVVEYAGDVDGELTIAYGSCDSQAEVSTATQRIGSTHVGRHPLAERHLDHRDQRPTKFVWLAPEDLSEGCLRAFLDDKLVGQSEKLVVTKRLGRRNEKRKSFADVAGEDSLWFDGVAYLKQKQPSDTFVAATKSKSFGILGGGMSGLLSSVSTANNL